MRREIQIKWDRIRNFMEKNGFGGILIKKVSNFAWFTGGKSNFVALYTENGASSLFVTDEKIYIVSNNIEMPRIIEEEIGKENFEKIESMWFEEEKLVEEIKNIAKGKVGCDLPVGDFIPVKLEKLHFPLLPEEIERYKSLGKEASEVMTNLCMDIKEGETEYEIAGKLSELLWERGIIPVVILIACDERLKKFRHPLPTEKKVKKNVMVVLCAKRDGLIVSLTRIVNFGKLDSELKKKHLAVCRIDSVFIGETMPGREIRDVFSSGIKAYEKEGYKEEWKLHHQGGPTGYLTRYSRGYLTDTSKIEENQSFAWNPSITGTKSEDTIIVKGKGCDIITEDKRWPLIEIEYKGKRIPRPDILIK